MGKITKKDVEHVAKLARLHLGEKEKEKFTQQLDKILKFMDKLNELDTKNVKPLAHIMPLKNVWRQDRKEKSLSREEILFNAPEMDKSGKFFKVPKVIE